MQWWLENPLTTEEQALLFEDGWIAVALMEPYRVDWIDPSGQSHRGSAIPVDDVVVDEVQKRRAISDGYKGVSPPLAPSDFVPWPRVLPPFLTGAIRKDALFASPDGQLVIARTPDARLKERRYDVIDRRGALVRFFAIATNQRVAGFGARHVYVVTMDEDQLETLSRHLWN